MLLYQGLTTARDLGVSFNKAPVQQGSTISMLLNIFSSTPSEPSAEGAFYGGELPNCLQQIFQFSNAWFELPRVATERDTGASSL